MCVGIYYAKHLMYLRVTPPLYSLLRSNVHGDPFSRRNHREPWPAAPYGCHDGLGTCQQRLLMDNRNKVERFAKGDIPLWQACGYMWMLHGFLGPQGRHYPTYFSTGITTIASHQMIWLSCSRNWPSRVFWSSRIQQNSLTKTGHNWLFQSKIRASVQGRATFSELLGLTENLHLQLPF